MGTASAFAGGFDLKALCAVAGTSDEVGVLGLLDCPGAQVAGGRPPRRRPYALQPLRDDPGFADDQLVEAERSACTTGTRPTSPTRPWPVGAVERARAGGRRWTGWRRSWPTCGPRSGGARGRGQLTVATDVAAHAALMGFSVELFETTAGPRRCSTRPTAADVRRLPRLYAAAGYACFVGRAETAKAHAHRATELEADPRYESCEPGYATFIEALGEVYCGNLPRYVELTGEVAALPGASRAFAIAAYVDGLQSAGRIDEALALTGAALEAAYELGNPYWVTYTTWIVGLALSSVEPQRALETWDEGMAYLEEHDVRFFVGFLARDAALLHTSDGQLETALTLFEHLDRDLPARRRGRASSRSPWPACPPCSSGWADPRPPARCSARWRSSRPLPARPVAVRARRAAACRPRRARRPPGGRPPGRRWT